VHDFAAFPPSATAAHLLRLQDGSPATWSADELADIVAIWRAVAEDFAAFDVDVTTDDPGAEIMATSGTRVAIGGAYQDCEWLGLCTGMVLGALAVVSALA
jgi:hypothetical protein